METKIRNNYELWMMDYELAASAENSSHRFTQIKADGTGAFQIVAYSCPTDKSAEGVFRFLPIFFPCGKPYCP
jgi:sarcosine oxidase gamma subunit